MDDWIEDAKGEDGWIPLKTIQENTTSELVEIGLMTFVGMGLLETKRTKQGEKIFRISGLARRMGLSWKSIRIR